VLPDAGKDLQYNPRTSNGNKETWVICCNKGEEKDKLMQYLIAVKLRRQKYIGDVLEETKDDASTTKSGSELLKQRGSKPLEKHYRGIDSSTDDGYWVLLSVWSQCSLKCGGGEQTQQWICFPPKNKGKPCIGESIEKRSCNQGPCPNVISGGENLIAPPKPNSTILQPVYKALPFSNSRQQYIKCVIKENDILYKTTEYDPDKRISTGIPARIVMNTRSISVFTGDSLNSALFTFNLQETFIKKSLSEYCCFYLISFNRQFEICGMNNCGSKTNPIFVNGWTFDFEFFQKKCYKQYKEDSLDVPNVPKILNLGQGEGKNAIGSQIQGVKLELKLPGTEGNNNYNNDNQQKPNMNQITKNIIDSRKEIIQDEVDLSQQTELQKKVKDVSTTTLTALRREINLEDMIKNEEIQKGKEENLVLARQLSQERKKKAIRI
jgi:hypothetical protein